MSIYKKFAGQTAIYGVSTIISRLFGFLLTPFYTAVFEKGVYGIFTNLFSYASIINQVLAFGMETSFFRYINKHEDKKTAVLNNAFWFIFGISTLFLILGLSFSHSITQFAFAEHTDFENRKLYVQMLLWISFFDALSVIPFAKLRAEGKSMRYGAVKLVNIFVFIGLNIFLLWLLPWVIQKGWIVRPTGYHGVWLGYVLVANLTASLLTFLLLLPQLKNIRFRIDRPILLSMLGYSFPVLIANISYIINENIDKIMMGKLLPTSISEAEVGIYGACAKIAIFLNIFVQAYRLGAEPFFFNHAKSENAPHTYARLMDLFISAVAVIFVGIVANISWIQLFIGEEYRKGMNVIPLLLIGYMFLGVYMNLSVWYRLTDQTRFGVYISSIGAVVTIVLNLIFIPHFSYMAAAAVSLFAYFVMMLISYLWGQKYYPIPYKITKNAVVLCTATVLAILSFWVFNRNLWIGNILLIGFITAVLYSEKELVMKMIRKK